MAFTIKKRGISVRPASLKTRGTETNTVATQTWVNSLLSKIQSWADLFKTNWLQVTGPLQAQTADITETLKADEIRTNKLVLLDSLGKPVVITLDANGKITTDSYFENIYMYPSPEIGLDIRSFFYTTGTIADNFKYQTPGMIMEKFIELSDLVYVDYDGNPDLRCFKISTADGSKSLLPKTLLISCPKGKLITSLYICDSDMNKTKQILLPDETPVSKLTINMPYFHITNDTTGEETDQFIELPDTYSETSNRPEVPPVPVFHPSPLGTDIFEGDAPTPVPPPSAYPTPPPPPPETRIGMPGAAIEDVTCGNPFEGQLPKNKKEIKELDTDESGVRWGDFVTSTYSNIVLYRNDFDTNKKQFLLVETKDA